jgi:DegV family protein with EDD domain
MSREVAVVTDSAAGLPPGIAEELGIGVVPIPIRFGEAPVADEIDETDFYRRLRSTPEAVSTATPSPGELASAFEVTGAPGVLCVTLGSSISGVFRSACIAAESAGPEVEVVDSGNASMAQGFVAMEAARVAAAGAGLAASSERARNVAERCRLIAAVDSFDQLRRSGRVSRLASYAGTVLNVNPVFRMQGGAIDAVGRPRTRRRAVALLEEELRGDVGARPVHLAVVHADAEAEARDLLDRVSRELDVVEAHLAGFAPVMGAHLGPGVVGVAWFCD